MRLSNPQILILRWFARGINACILAFVSFFVLAELFGTHTAEPGPLSTSDKITLVFFPTGLLLGLMLAWKWEGIGGLTIIISMVGLTTIRPDLIINGINGGLIIAGVVILGAVFLLVWYFDKTNKSLAEKTPE
jgi:hypothetical protein